jgi:acetolactate synthase-1/3 small subunit
MFAARAFNIDSLAVGRTDDPTLSRMTIVILGDDKVVEQVRKQLVKIVEVVKVQDFVGQDVVARDQLVKIVEVVKVQDFVGQDVVARDLMLLSVACTPEKRPELLALIEMFNGKVVDIGAKFVMVEVAGPESKVEAFIESCRPYGIKSIVRTGTVAMARQPRTKSED